MDSKNPELEFECHYMLHTCLYCNELIGERRSLYSRLLLVAPNNWSAIDEYYKPCTRYSCILVLWLRSIGKFSWTYWSSPCWRCINWYIFLYIPILFSELFLAASVEVVWILLWVLWVNLKGQLRTLLQVTKYMDKLSQMSLLGWCFIRHFMEHF